MDEDVTLRKMGNATFSEVLLRLPIERRADFEMFRSVFVEGYVAGAKDVLAAVPIGAAMLREKFDRAQLENAVRQKLGL